MPHLSLTALGGFAARLDGHPLEAFGTDKVRALLTYLAVESAHPHQRTALAALFWPDSPPEKAAHNLRQSLLLLRRALDNDEASTGRAQQPFVVLNRQTVQLNPLGDWQLDVARFTELLSVYRQHSHAQAESCRSCIGWLDQAANLYRGDFLAGFTLRDSVPFEEWQLVQQEGLHRQAVEILAQLVNYYAGCDEYGLVQRYAGRLVTLDPWHEQGQLQLLRALAHTGQVMAAAEQYASYCRTLDQEFGIKPAAAVTALFQHIQAGQLEDESGIGRLSDRRRRFDSSPVEPGERRQITVLSCSWHAPAGDDDPEDLHQRLARSEPWIQALLDRYGGYRRPLQGDEWLSYFGYPQAYEDAARRAVHVGLALVAATHGANAMRVGIHTGVMVVNGGDGSGGTAPEPIGDVPGVARSCQSLAGLGTVLISAETERLVRGWFDCQPLEAHPESAQTVPTYQVLGECTGQRHLDWLAQMQSLTPLAGREREFDQLINALESPGQGGGAIVLLSGEPGIGKSRLLWELRQRCAPAVRWLESRCSSYFRNTPLSPIISLLEQLLGIAEDNSLEARQVKLKQTLEQYGLGQPGAAWLLALLLGLPSDPPTPQPITAQQRERMREMMVALLRRYAAAHPLVLVIEDLHWADPSTVEWIGASLQAVAAAPCLTVLTCRPTFSPPWLPGSYLRRLTLAPLEPPAIERMLANLDGSVALPNALRQNIITQSDGVPLFVEELTRALLESGTQPPDAAIPATLRDLLLARLERVGAARETAGWAAALGREFAYPVLAASVPYDEPRLQADLATLVEAELITLQRNFHEVRYVFKHILVQEAAHTALLRRTRQAYHRRIAETYAADFPQISETQPELLAQHYQQAELPTEAADYWLRAGERAVAQGAGQEARTFFEHAIGLVKAGDDEQHWRGLVGRERALDLSSDREAQQAALVALHDLAETMDDDARRAYGYLRQTAHTATLGEYQATLALADVASLAARRAGDLALELHALAYKAQTLTFFQELEATRQVLESLLFQVDQLADDSVRAQIFTVAAHYYLETGDLVRAVQFQRQAGSVAQQAGNHPLALTINANLGMLYALLGLYAQACTTLEHGQERAAVFAGSRIQAGHMLHLGYVYWCWGKLNRAQKLLQQALGMLTLAGDVYGQAACHGYLGYLLEATGELTLAAEQLAQAREGFAAIGLEEDRIEAQAVEARVMLTLGQRDAARQLVTEVWIFLRDQGGAGFSELSLVCVCVADVLEALADPAMPAQVVIDVAYHDLMQRAAKISDAKWRQSFLENIPTNRMVVERWLHLSMATARPEITANHDTDRIEAMLA